MGIFASIPGEIGATSKTSAEQFRAESSILFYPQKVNLPNYVKNGKHFRKINPIL
jgi:hypothetical protein